MNESGNRTRAKGGLRKWISKSFRSDASSLSPAASISSAPVQAAAAAATTSSNISALYQVHITTPPNILDLALDKVSVEERLLLQGFIPSSTNDAQEALEHALSAAKEKQQCCLDKRWKFTIAGRAYSLSEQADKVVHWLNRFKDIGDVVVNADPIHAGLPWAGFRLLLEAVVTEANQMHALLTGCETALYVSNRLKAYIEFLNKLPVTLTRNNLEDTIVQLYAYILGFLAKAIKNYQYSTTHRALHAFGVGAEVQDFVAECNALEAVLDRSAASCDRVLYEQSLQNVLQELAQLHSIRASLHQLEIKIDLDKLPYVQGAEFDSYEADHEMCHPATRVDILRQIHDWALQAQSKRIFWLNGMAGTGKSTIARTMAAWLVDQGHRGTVDLGASFFFKRGEGNRSSAVRFFPTIAKQLAVKMPALARHIASAIDSDPTIGGKQLAEQFDKLIHQPVQLLNSSLESADDRIRLVILIDALDECEKSDDIRVILRLFSQLPKYSALSLQLFLTSRPELPILLGFREMSGEEHLDMILHDLPPTVIRNDIRVYLQDTFTLIRNRYNNTPAISFPLENDWPGEATITTLVDMAVPLFIVAATMYRFVNSLQWPPQARLAKLLRFGTTGHMSQIEHVYLPVLQQFIPDETDDEDAAELYQDFRTIVGSIITLTEPLSVASLAALLDIPSDLVVTRLEPLHSVLQVPAKTETPIRTLHLSFSEFLMGIKLQKSPFGIDKAMAHQTLLIRCLDLLQSQNGLHEDLCNMKSPGRLRREIDSANVRDRLRPELQYACQYWVHHFQQSVDQARNYDRIYSFLQHHFLHWFEALSLMGKASAIIDHISNLRSAILPNSVVRLGAFIDDMYRFALVNIHVADLAPLQLYSAAIIFAPRESLVRKICGRIPPWIPRPPTVPREWSTELQVLGEHDMLFEAIAFSHDSQQFASASRDHTLRLWSMVTGQVLKEFTGHTDEVSTIAFSPDSQYLASGSADHTIKLWELAMSQTLQTFVGHTDGVTALVFLQHGQQIVSGSLDHTVRLWDVKSGGLIRILETHHAMVTAIALSHVNQIIASALSDYTVRLCDVVTACTVGIVNTHENEIRAIDFSPDGRWLASASYRGTLIVWDVLKGEKQQTFLYDRGLTAVAFSPDSQRLALGEFDRSVQIVDLVTGQLSQKFEGHAGSVMALAFSQDGRRLASGSFDQTVRIWNSGFDQSQHSQPCDVKPSTEMDMTLSQDRLRSISDLSNQTMAMLDMETSQEIPQSPYEIMAMSISPDEKYLILAYYCGTMQIWNVAADCLLLTLKNPEGRLCAIASSPDNRRLVSASDDQNIRLWDAVTGEMLLTCGPHRARVNVVAFSNDSRLIASGTSDGFAAIWDIDTGHIVQAFHQHRNWITAVAFSHDNFHVATACASSFTIYLWSIASGQTIQNVVDYGGEIREIAFSHNGQSLAAASSDDNVQIWDITTGQSLGILEMSRVTNVRFTLDDSVLITNRGAIAVNDVLEGVPRSIITTRRISVTEKWIQVDGCNLLWLPYEYRTLLTVCNDSTVAIGRGDNEVVFIHLDVDKAPKQQVEELFKE